jgi:NitT/TauT family transport system substrate-binding protein
MSSGELERALSPTKLEAKVFNAGPSVIEALFAGAIDVAYVGPGPALNAHARSHGAGLRVVAGGCANGVVVVARKGSGIRTLADLAGRPLGTPQLGNTQDLSARHYLSAVLGQKDLGNVRPVDLAEHAGLFARGELDAAWVPEPWGQRLISETDAVLIAEEKDLWPGGQFTQTLVVTTPEFLARRPDVVENILRVHRSWTLRLTTEPKKYEGELSDALSALTGRKLPNGVLHAAMGRVHFTDEPLPETLRTFAAWTHDLGFGEREVDLQGLVDTTVLLKAATGAN